MELKAWKKKENAKRETYVIEHDGSMFLYEKVGAARHFYQMFGSERRSIDEIPDWIKKQISEASEAEIDETKENKDKTDKITEKRDRQVGPDQTKQVESPGIELANPVQNSVNSITEILEGNRIIAFSDIENLKKLSIIDRLLLFQKTPRQLIRQRRGFLLPQNASKDKKLLTDVDFKMFQYVDSMTMQQEANLAFLFEWSAVVESEKYFEAAGEVVVRGYIQVEINGKLQRRACGGSCIKKGMMDWGDTLECATSEMKKRGLKSFGFNADVYRQDEIE